MPKTKLAEQFGREPRPIDMPKALILERYFALPHHPQDMADALGVSLKTWYIRMKQPSAEWTVGELLAACKALGVDISDLRSAIRY